MLAREFDRGLREANAMLAKNNSVLANTEILEDMRSSQREMLATLKEISKKLDK